eukprot:gnl/Trimastix_PCT/2960.p2 GENE.gnl/Trimastix_PCT/2960~~gnl/Trimastix_PCT/2960.p2  ORF type:complete len:498 (-),score=191.59 gnl/Trimastix_PCT/2960:1377-2810(-)
MEDDYPEHQADSSDDESFDEQEIEGVFPDFHVGHRPDRSQLTLPTNIMRGIQLETAAGKAETRNKDKADRATVEQVLDPRTRLVLFKLIGKGEIAQVHGCISTGKEANVYHAKTPSGEDRAIKIYKTSILVFKDRDRYVTGEFRWRRGYCKSNPRKMVRVWAEKEFRNLSRLNASGIPSPRPLILRQHVLVMDFIGEDGWAAPRLKDAADDLDEEALRRVYFDVVRMMRVLYHNCRLIHADLSEYNMMYYQGRAYIIDVSQSVEHNHPHALEFLRMDARNVNNFFRKYRVRTLSAKELFDFVVDPSLAEADVPARLLELQALADGREEVTEDDAVFMQAYIPRTLFEVDKFEEDTLAIAQGKSTDQMYYTVVTGIKDTLAQTNAHALASVPAPAPDAATSGISPASAPASSGAPASIDAEPAHAPTTAVGGEAPTDGSAEHAGSEVVGAQTGSADGEGEGEGGGEGEGEGGRGSVQV